LILLWGPPEDLEVAAGDVSARARRALEGVPAETRQYRTNGESRFERVLPGPARMYPETDLPPLPVRDDRLAALTAGLPERDRDLTRELADLGFPPHRAARLAGSPRAPLLVRAVRELGASPALAARLLVDELIALRRAGVESDGIPGNSLLDLVRAVAEGRLPREAAPGSLRALARGEPLPAPSPADPGEVRAAVLAAADRAPPIPDPERRTRHLMGTVMGDLFGRAPGREVRETLREVVG
jgi:glutamyl-tRNA(Gln) amidotransferase subunit E